MHPTCASLHLLIPNSRSNPLPPPLPLAATSLFTMPLVLVLFRKQVHLCHILDSTYKSRHTAGVSLTYLLR